MLIAADRIEEIDFFLGVFGYVLLYSYPLTAGLSGFVIDFTMRFFVNSDMVRHTKYTIHQTECYKTTN